MPGYARAKLATWIAGDSWSPAVAEQLDQAIYDLKRQTFNIKDYASEVGKTRTTLGNGDATDESPACAAMIADALASGANPRCMLPKPSSSYRFKTPITIQPPSGAFCSIEMIGPGGPAGNFILYDGANSTSCFQLRGLKNSRFAGMGVVVNSAITGVPVWDLDCDSTRASMSHVVFENCPVALASAGDNCIGYRMGHTATVGGIDELTWLNSPVAGNGSAAGQLGWVNEHANGLQYVWVNSGGDHLAKQFTNSPTAGSAAALAGASGGDAMWFHSSVGSFNAIDFEFVTGGTYGIYGVRYESGTTFLKVGGGSTAIAIDLSAEIADYAAGKVIWINGRPVTLDALVYAYGTDHTAEFLTATGSSPQVGQIKMRGALRGADPCYTISADAWAVDLQLQKLNSVNQPTTFFNGYTKTIASAATITLPPMDGVFTISGTTTITSITAGRIGQRVTLVFSGALTLTDGSNLKLAGNFVTTADDTITLICDGTNWIETARSVN